MIIQDRTWWLREFENINLGDERLKKRLVKTAVQLASQPTQPINQACEGWADTKAAYRLFKNEKMDMKEILRVHSLRTRERLKSCPTIIAATDKSYINYDSHQKTKGLGLIGSNQKHQTQGLIMQTSIAVTTDGMPMGILDQRIWARNKFPQNRSHKVKSIKIEKKESFSWIKSLEKTAELMSDTNVHVVTVADRESDIYEFIAHANFLNVSFVIRAAWDRALLNKNNELAGYLWEHMGRQKRAGVMKVEAPTRGANEPARTATVNIYFSRVSIRRPQKDRFNSKSTLPEKTEVDVVWVKEVDAPKNATELEWMLLTNVRVSNSKDAAERVHWYKLRWTIEVFHKILKSGCQVESCRLQTGERLMRYLTLFSIIAWRLHWMTHMNRINPDLPCDQILSENEWRALFCKINRTDNPPKKPPTIREAIRWIASLGGFLGRKGDLEPGTITLWRGWQRLYDITDDYQLFSSS